MGNECNRRSKSTNVKYNFNVVIFLNVFLFILWLNYGELSLLKNTGISYELRLWSVFILLVANEDFITNSSLNRISDGF